MKKYWTTIISLAALALSVYAAFVCDKRIEADWMGVLVGVLALLTSVLLGWQIFSLFNINSIKKDVEDIKKNTTMIMENNLVEFHSSMALYISSHEDYQNNNQLAHKYIMNRLYMIIHLYNVKDYNRCESQITTLLTTLKGEQVSPIPKEYKEVLMPLISHVAGLRDIPSHCRILEVLSIFDT